MSDSTLTWLMIFVAVTSVAVVIQMGVMVGMFLTVRKTAARMDGVVSDLQSRTAPLLANAEAIVADARPKLQALTADLVDGAASLKRSSQRLDHTLGEVLDRGKLHILRADEMVGRALDRVEETTTVVAAGVTSPVRQVSGIIHGISAGVSAFLSGRKQPARARGTADEEMFI